jgi:hypothetical protein
VAQVVWYVNGPPPESSENSPTIFTAMYDKSSSSIRQLVDVLIITLFPFQALNVTISPGASVRTISLEAVLYQ